MRLVVTVARTLALALTCLAGPTRAEPPAAPAAPGSPFPASGSALPTNARVVFFGDSALTDVTFARIGGDDALAFETAVANTARNEVAFLVDPGALAPGDTLIIEPRCPSCSAGEAASWSVLDVVDEDVPVFAPGEPTDAQVASLGTTDLFGFTTIESHGISATLPPVTDASGFLLLRTESDEGPSDIDRGGFASGAAPSVATSVPAGAARRSCMRAFAVDVVGNETEYREPICAEVGAAGCAQASSSSAVLALLALALVRSRRARVSLAACACALTVSACCDEEPRALYPQQPETECRTGVEQGMDIAAWDCIDGQRVVAWRTSSALLGCSDVKVERAPCGTATAFERTLHEQDRTRCPLLKPR